jgi:hypothetical protein
MSHSTDPRVVFNMTCISVAHQLFQSSDNQAIDGMFAGNASCQHTPESPSCNPNRHQVFGYPWPGQAHRDVRVLQGTNAIISVLFCSLMVFLGLYYTSVQL